MIISNTELREHRAPRLKPEASFEDINEAYLDGNIEDWTRASMEDSMDGKTIGERLDVFA